MFVVLSYPIAMNTANQSLPCQREGDRDSGGGIAFPERWGRQSLRPFRPPPFHKGGINSSALRAPTGPLAGKACSTLCTRKAAIPPALRATSLSQGRLLAACSNSKATASTVGAALAAARQERLQHGYEIIDETISMHIITGGRKGRPYSVSCFFDHPCF